MISRDMVNIKIGEPLEGTPEQQKQARDLYDYENGVRETI